MDKEKLTQLLQASQIPDTEKVKAVTAELQKNYYSQPESLLLLIDIAITHGDAGIRQLASVQALRITPKHWAKIPAEQNGLAKKHLLEGAVNDQTTPSRHSKCRLLAAMVGLDLENKTGDDFLPVLVNLINQGSTGFSREVGSYLLYSLLENNPQHFADHLEGLLKMLDSILKDDNPEVRLNAVRAIGAVLMLIEPEEDEASLEAVQSFIRPMVQLLKAAVDSGEDAHYKEVFEVLQSFLAYDSALLSKHLKDLVQFMIDLASNVDVDDDARCQALAFLSQCVSYRRMKIQSMKDMGAQLMVKSMEILSEISDDADDDEDMTPARTAMSLIDQLSSDLPPRQVIVPLLDNFPKFAHSENAGHRKSAMLALGTAAEGAPDFIATQLKTLLPIIIALLNDPDSAVRHAALVGLIHIADEMADELAAEHEPIIAALLKNLQAATEQTDKKSVSVIRAVCGAIDSLVGEGFEGEIIATYGPKLIVPMGRLLSHDDFGVKAAAAGAIGAIAIAMDTGFKPYFKDVMSALEQYVTVKDSDDALALRSAVGDSMARIANAVGPEDFQPYVLPLMKASEEALSLDNARLKETTFVLWAALSKVYGTQFAHFLPQVLKGLFECLELEEEELSIPGLSAEESGEGVLVIGGRKIKIKAAADEAEEVIAAGDDDEEWDDLEDFAGVTAVALEQEIALEVLGDVITHSCDLDSIKQYLETAMTKVLSLAEHSYEGSRKAAISTLWRSYARVWELVEEQTGVKWQPGIPLKQTPDPVLIKLGEMVAKATLAIWADESERGVVTEINRNVGATLKACGPAILTQENMLEQAVSVLGTLITRSHPCQQDLGDEMDEQDVEDGSSEFDWLVIDTALDVVLALATVLGSDFAELWKIFQRPVVKFASSQESIERSTAVGVIAEAIKYMGASVTQFTDSLLPVLVHRLSDETALTKSNAAYATGQLIFNSTETSKTIPQYPAILRKLEPLLQIQESRMVDNVCGCLARMMYINPNPSFVEKVMPAVIEALPLKEDYEENVPIYQCIFKLYEQQNPTMMQLRPQVLPILQQVLAPPEEQLDDETRALVTKLAQGLQQ